MGERGPSFGWELRRWCRRLGALCLAVLLAAACTRPPELPEELQPDHLLIVEVYPSGYAPDGDDQYLRLYNPRPAPVDLQGWSVGDGRLRATFGPGVQIRPGQSLYIARTAAGFTRVMGVPPDAVWAGPATGGPPALNGGYGLLLGRASGIAVLRDGAGHVVDQVVWGQAAGAAGVGWVGPAVPPPALGEVIDRGRDELTWDGQGPGQYRRDTHTAADWKQGTAWLDRRTLRPGQTFMAYPTFTARAVTAYSSPDSSYEVLARLLDGAQERIEVNFYTFTNLVMAGKLAAAANRGVQVRVLLEAISINGLTDQERYAARLVQQAGGEVRWIINQPGAGITGRYVFNHAKYGVVDRRSVFVQSENVSITGVPIDPTAGNRGWGVVVAEPGLARYMEKVFAADWATWHGDVFPYQEGTPFGPPPPGFSPETQIPAGAYPRPFRAFTLNQQVRVTPVLAPDHALLERLGVIGLIRSAQRSILVEQLYIHYHWGPREGSPESHPNLYLQELLLAARRGVKVRILLSDAYIDPSAPRDNAWTAAYVNRLAAIEGLDLEARVMRTDLTLVDKIHNKGLVVDGERVLVSSINWSRNSPQNNREVGLILEHPALGQYFTDIFTYDWYNGWPADYPLITEVDPAAGFVEITTFGTRPLDLTGWLLQTSGGELRLPAGAHLAPAQPLVLVGSGPAFRARFGDYPGLVELPGLALSPDRGRVELWQGPILVDRMGWGGGLPGWFLSGQRSICRHPAGRDTNTYLEWTLFSPPSPGAPGCGR